MIEKLANYAAPRFTKILLKIHSKAPSLISSKNKEVGQTVEHIEIKSNSAPRCPLATRLL